MQRSHPHQPVDSEVRQRDTTITLSVVIPTYNRSELVVEAVESVLAQQTDEKLEVIVVDDGSQDDTRHTLEKYAGRINYKYQPNAGMNAARNAGIAAASGEYVALLDSDDAWLPFTAAIQVAVMRRLPDVGFAFSNFFAWRRNERSPNGLGKWMLPGASIAQHARDSASSIDLQLPGVASPFRVHVCDIYRLSLHQPVVLPSTSIIRRDVLDTLGPLAEDNWMCGDWEYFARASKKFGCAYIDKELALNRSHDDAVRLMRRSVTDRTRQRIESVRRTWRADPDFMGRFAADVDRVESREWRVLFKRACYVGDFAAARDQLREVERLSRRPNLGLRLLWLLMHVPLSRETVAAIRQRAR